MPSTLDAPVLQVDANVIHKVDTSNPQNLFSMWTVFARCADNVAQGRRLENLSWRLWTRETFCVEAGAARLSSDTSSDALATSSIAATPSSAKPIPSQSQPSTDDVPQLSGSVESLADEETVELTAAPSTADLLRPRIRRQDSCGSSRSRGRERHITSDDLEKMVVSIVQEKEPLKAKPAFQESTTSTTTHPATSSLTATPEPNAESDAQAEDLTPSEPATSNTPAPDEQMAISEPFPTLPAAEPEAVEETQFMPEAAPLQKSKSTTEVIRGFAPTHKPIEIPEIFMPPPTDEKATLAGEDAIPDPMSEPAAMVVQSKKATFALGGSSSCEDSMSDPSRSLEMHKSAMSHMRRKPAPPLGEEETGSLKSALHPSRHALGQKKQASFSSEVLTRTIPSSSAVLSDDEQSDSDDNDESAIEDDSSDWEDSVEESGRSSMDDKTMFQRVDSTVHLPSRRSLITLMIQRSERDVKNGLNTSQSTTVLPRARTVHQPPSMAALPNDSDGPALMVRQRSRGPPSPLRPINEIPRSAAQPIMASGVGAAGVNYAPALSPRTNRRTMLSTELTESLRRHLLWERQQKTSTANAVLKRRHTSHDVANLRQYPEPVHMNKDNNDVNGNSWDQYLNRDAFNGYHAKGW